MDREPNFYNSQPKSLLRLFFTLFLSIAILGSFAFVPFSTIIKHDGNTEEEASLNKRNIVNPINSHSPFMPESSLKLFGNDLDGISDDLDLDDDNDGITDIIECGTESMWEVETMPASTLLSSVGRLITQVDTANISISTSLGAAVMAVNPTLPGIDFPENISDTYLIDFDRPISDLSLYFGSVGRLGTETTQIGNFTITLEDGTEVNNLPTTIAAGYADFTPNPSTLEPVERILENGVEYFQDPTDNGGESQGYAVFTFPSLEPVSLYSRGIRSISFQVLAGPDWNASFGIRGKVLIDTDRDNTLDCYDLDSDGDGCPDAIEGDATFSLNDLQNGTLMGGVDATGIPLIAGTAGQGVGVSKDLSTIVCCDPAVSGFPDRDGDGIADLCDQDSDNDGITNEDEGFCTSRLLYSFETDNASWSDDFNNAGTNIRTTYHSSTPTTPGGCPASNIPASPAGGFIFSEDIGGGATWFESPENLNIDASTSLGGELSFYWINGAYDGQGVPDEGVAINLIGGGITLTAEYDVTGLVNAGWQLISLPLTDATWSGTEAELITVLADLDQISIRVETINGGGATCANIEYFGLDEIALGCTSLDTDGDGMADYLDLDSDGDGCPDVIEGGGSFMLADTENDALTGGIDANGLPISSGAAGQGIGVSQDANTVICCDPAISGYPDTDGDGITDRCDLDDDNDGITDRNEWSVQSSAISIQGGNTWNLDLTGSEVCELVIDILQLDNSFSFFMNGTSLTTSELQFWGADMSVIFADGSRYGAGGVPNIWDLGPAAPETPSVRIIIDENGQVSMFGSKVINGPLFPLALVNGNVFNPLPLNENGTNNLSISQIVTGPTILEGVIYTTLCDDTNGDGIANHVDLDSDGDGCPDAIEGAADFVLADLERNILIGGVDANGIPIMAGATGQAVGLSQDGAMVLCCDAVASGYPDNDGDGVADGCDADDDNDGIRDTTECGLGGIQWAATYSTIANPYEVSSQVGGIGISYTSDVAISLVGELYNPAAFPADFEVPITNPSIRKAEQSTNTIHFSEPVQNPVLAFSSLGQPTIPVPLVFSTEVEVLWSQNVVIDGPNRITGREGFAIIQFTGTFSSISFSNLAEEFYSNVVVGIRPFSCDTDRDGIADILDEDSDGDGCLDVIESGGVDDDNDGVLDGTGFTEEGLVADGVGGYDDTDGDERIPIALSIDADPQDIGVERCQVATFTVEASSQTTDTFALGNPVYLTPGNANEGLQYQWYQGNPNAGGEALTDGAIFQGTQTNSLQVIDAGAIQTEEFCVQLTHENNACAEEIRCAFLTIIESAQLVIQESICEGGTYVQGSSVYTEAGTYTDTLISQLTGCDSIVTTNLTVIPAPATLNQVSICEGETYTVGTSVYSLPGTYTALSTGCDSVVMTELVIIETPPIELTPDVQICEGQPVTLRAFGADTYLWSSGEETDSILVSPTETTTYSVIGVNGECTAEMEFVEVEVLPQPVAMFSRDSVVLLAPVQVQFTNLSQGASQYFWDFGDGTQNQRNSPTHIYRTAGIYEVQLIAANELGCQDTASASFEVLATRLFQPTAFSPNGDGENDEFFISTGDGIRSISVSIYDRWGRIMFQSEEPDFRWDGTINEGHAPEGVYLCQIAFTDERGREYLLTESVTLIR